MTTTSFRSQCILLVLVLTSLFVGSFSVHAQTIYTSPDGPPPNYNAPAPIHEGATGQGKFWSSIPGYSIGALYFKAVGSLTEWAVAGNGGVAATQFCLGTTGVLANLNFPESTEGLNCVTAETGWGGGEGQQLPSGTYTGDSLAWNADNQEWQSHSFIRRAAPWDNELISAFVFGNFPDTIYGQIFGYPDLVTGETPGLFAFNGPLYFRDGNIDTTNKILAGMPGQNYRVGWVDPATLGLGSEGSLPEATVQGQILYWDTVTSSWKTSITGSGYEPQKGFEVNYGIGERLVYKDGNGNCTTSSTLVSETIPNTPLEQNLRKWNCTDHLRVDVTENGDEPNIFVKSLEHDNGTWPTCSDEDGGLVRCPNIASGQWEQTTPGSYTFIVPQGVTEINVTAIGGGGGGGAGGMGRIFDLMYPTNATIPGIGPLWEEIFGAGGGGGGGGSGEITTETITVEPGTSFSVTVGAGGQGGCPFRYSPSGWWYNSDPCEIPWSPSLGNGQNGQDSLFECEEYDDCDSVIGDGGFGGGLGQTLTFTNPSSLTQSSLATLNSTNVPGGLAGANGNGQITATNGSSGLVWYAQGEDIDDGITTCLEALNDLTYKVIYPGGSGGHGGNYAGGGAGGPATPVPTFCASYGNLSTSGHGTQGNSGVNPGHGGAGGGGGNSQHPDTTTNLYSSSFDLGYGAKGGNGADGKVSITW